MLKVDKQRTALLGTAVDDALQHSASLHVHAVKV